MPGLHLFPLFTIHYLRRILLYLQLGSVLFYPAKSRANIYSPDLLFTIYLCTNKIDAKHIIVKVQEPLEVLSILLRNPILVFVAQANPDVIDPAIANKNSRRT